MWFQGIRAGNCRLHRPNLNSFWLLIFYITVPAYTVRCSHQIFGFPDEIFNFEILQIGFCEDFLENKMGESYLR